MNELRASVVEETTQYIVIKIGEFSDFYAVDPILMTTQLDNLFTNGKFKLIGHLPSHVGILY